MDDIKRHYLFALEDEKNLSSLKEIFLPHADRFSQDFYDFLRGFPEAAAFFPTPEAVERRKVTIKQWLLRLFEGNYDSRFFLEIERIGRIHVKRGTPIHWVTASMDFKRQYLLDVLYKEINDPNEFLRLSRSLNKILDINLDVLTSSYHEEEMKRIFITHRMDSVLISFAERFTYGLNIILILALIGISLSVVGLFVTEIYRITMGGFETGILSALGTLLIIWIMIELMSTEIKYLKGERFHIEVFVSVALVAFIRELLIASIAGESLVKLAVFLGAVLVLGVVYFLISRIKA
jgi:uncharacterized membrane protein (DUF373 family)